MEQLVLLLIIGAISLINWLMQKSAERREQRKVERTRRVEPQRAEPLLREPETPVPDAAERTRKFLEALGLPEEALPPKPVEHEPEPAFVIEPPPLPVPPPIVEVPTRVAPAKPVWAGKAPSRSWNEPTAPTRPTFDWRASAKSGHPGAARPAASRGADLIAGLKHGGNGLEDAIVLAEIIGRPVSMRM